MHQKPGHTHVDLWTWQKPVVLETLLLGRTWHAKTTSALVRSELGDGFLAAYLWLREELGRRLSPPPAGAMFPVWAYTAARDARADWRTGTQPAAVKLRLQVPERRLVRSGLCAWSDAAAGLDLRMTGEQVTDFLDAFDTYASTLDTPTWNGETLKRPDLPESWLLTHLGGQALPQSLETLLTHVMDSWHDIFDLEACRQIHPQEIVQACLWEIRPGDLVTSWTYAERT